MANNFNLICTLVDTDRLQLGQGAVNLEEVELGLFTSLPFF